MKSLTYSFTFTLMAFRFVRSAGSVHEPATILMYASGIVRPGGVVVLGDASVLGGLVSGATATGASTTNIFGVCLDYAQGASDTQVRVIPFVPGQIWEADCVNAITTTNIGIRHVLADATTLRNTTGGTANGTSETTSVGIFLGLGITGATTGSGKVLGTFLQRVPFLGKDGVTATT